MHFKTRTIAWRTLLQDLRAISTRNDTQGIQETFSSDESSRLSRLLADDQYMDVLIENARVLAIDPKEERYPLTIDIYELCPSTWKIRWENDPEGKRQWRSIHSFELVKEKTFAPTRRDMLATALRTVLAAAIAAAKKQCAGPGPLRLAYLIRNK